MSHNVSARLLSIAVVAVLALLPVASGCSSDAADSAKETLDSANEELEKAGDKAGARVVAEAFRARLKFNDTADEQGLRSVDALTEVAGSLPGNPDISGIEDGDGDGMDDDGKVQVTAGDEQACVTIAESGTDTSVEGGSC